MQSTGAPPPEVATTRHCRPPGCTLLTMSASVLHSPDGPSQSPAFTLHHQHCVRERVKFGIPFQRRLAQTPWACLVRCHRKPLVVSLKPSKRVRTTSNTGFLHVVSDVSLCLLLCSIEKMHGKVHSHL